MNNKCYIASAGSGKTTLLVKEALQTAKQTKKKVAIITYTSRNQEEIIKKIHKERNHIPSNLVILGWYEFLIKYWIRPFKGDVLPELYDIQITLCFAPAITNSKPIGKNNYVSRHNGDTKSKYFTSKFGLFSNYVSEFAYQCHNKNKPNLINRLSLIFEHLYFDEAQDFVGYDFDIAKLLITSPVGCTFALDPRQHTYSTSKIKKHRVYSGRLDVFIKEKVNTKKKQYIELDELTLIHSHRCNDAICEIASRIDGVYSPTTPCQCPECLALRSTFQYEQGVFWVREADVNKFISRYKATTLRWDKSFELGQHNHIEIMNYGESKGLTLDACLIIPTAPFLKCLKTGVFNITGTSQAKIYVAVTRARFAVGIIVPSNWTSVMQIPFWES